MSTKTSNYNLTKPDYTDTADIAVLNSNFDTIDTTVKSVSDVANAAKTAAATAQSTADKKVDTTTYTSAINSINTNMSNLGLVVSNGAVCITYNE